MIIEEQRKSKTQDMSSTACLTTLKGFPLARQLTADDNRRATEEQDARHVKHGLSDNLEGLPPSSTTHCYRAHHQLYKGSPNSPAWLQIFIVSPPSHSSKAFISSALRSKP